MNLNIVLIHHNKPSVFWHHQYSKQLTLLKKKIDEGDNREYWDSAKKYTNPYELIYSPYHSLQNHIILRKKVLSRAYYKFYEIMKKKNLDTYFRDNINSFHIAEGPGGFIQAWNDQRKSLGFTDQIYGITLLDDKNKHIRGWDYGKKYFQKHNNITVNYGADNTGDLFVEENIKYICDRFSDPQEKPLLITGDGGFDFSGDFCSQETNSFPLVFMQFYLAVQTQAKGGIFLIKMFDIFETATIQLIEMMSSNYSNFKVVKPNTSRPANSEKYLLFSGFNGLTREDNIKWTSLLQRVLAYHKEKKGYIHRINMGPISSNFCNKLYEELRPFLKDQVDNLKQTHRLIDLMKDKSETAIQELKEEKTNMRSLQIIKATSWIQIFHPR